MKIRDFPAFSSSIHFNHFPWMFLPTRANDEVILTGMNNNNNQYPCSYTTDDPKDKSWWIVDLKGFYKTLSVCILNRNDGTQVC